MATLIDGFEDGDVSEWTNNNASQFYASNLYSFSGSFSGFIQENGADAVSLSPPEFDGAAQPDSFTFYWRESSNNSGIALSLLNSAGEEILAMGTDNPQWLLLSGDGNFFQLDDGSGTLQDWIKFEVTFDWNNQTATLTGNNTNGSQSGSATGGFSSVSEYNIATITSGAAPWQVSDNNFWWIDDLQATNIVTRPTTPSNLTASAAADDITLNWDASDFGGDPGQYNILRDGSVVGSVAAGTTTFTDTGLLDGKAFSYQVEAENSVGTSSLSNTASATTEIPAPTSASQTVNSDTDIDVAWTDNCDNEDNFRVQVSEDGGPFQLVGTVGANTTTINYTATASVDTHQFRVRAETAATVGPYTTTDTVITEPDLKNLSVSGTTATSVSLAWDENSALEDGFRVRRRKRLNGQAYPFQLIANLTPNTTAYTDTTAEPATTYDYRVTAYNSAGETEQGQVRATTDQGDIRQTNVPSEGWYIEIEIDE